MGNGALATGPKTPRSSSTILDPKQPSHLLMLDRAARGQRSTLGQPRLAHPLDNMVGILGVLEDGQTFPAFNCEAGVDPQHLRGLFPGLLKLSRLRMGARQQKMRKLQTGLPRCAFAAPT